MAFFSVKAQGCGDVAKSQNINTNEPAAWDLNYNLEYEYFEEFAHRVKKIGNIYYRYDENGNTIEESYGGLSSDEDWASVHPGRGQAKRLGNSEKSVPYGIGKKDPAKDNGNSGNDSGYRRIYFWDEENRLKRSEDASNTVEYLYDADGQRTVKYSGKHDEALYFDSMWQENTDNPSFRLMKHIYLGETRIASRMKIEGDYSHGYESINTYYYHSDHLGSANIVTDYQGDVYEHIEYTPYGELFEEIKSDNFDRIPFRFTGKELDRETNLYYHGARYMDPRTSRWISSDPAGWELLNPMQDGKPRQGFSILESQGWFGYVNNNPVRFVDPTGEWAHIAVGAAIGAIAGSTVSAVSQYVESGSISGRKVLMAGAAGAVSGGLAATGVGLLGQIAGNLAIGGAQNLGDQLVDNDNNFGEIDGREFAGSLAMGALGGLLGGSGADANGALGAVSKQATRRISNAFQNNTGSALTNEIGKAMSWYMKSSGTNMRNVTPELIKGVLRSNTPAGIEITSEMYKDISNVINRELLTDD